jgi:hypothetical protein
MAKEIRITFKESENDLYDYVKGKSSPSAFLKDLATLEQKRENLYLTINTVIPNDNTIIQYNVPTEVETKSVEELDFSDLCDD